MNGQAVVEQIDALLQLVEPDIDTPTRAGDYAWFRAEGNKPGEMRMRCIAAIERLAPPNSAYVTQARAVNASTGYDGPAVPMLAGILRALREDYDAGYMRTVEELVHADLFADFLEMADELLSKSYKDPAAVLAGSVLEEHLRKLAVRSGLSTEDSNGRPLKADTLNANLAKVPVYNKVEQKNVTAWLGLRNEAAHGRYDNYGQAQVEALVRDVRSFLGRYPA